MACHVQHAAGESRPAAWRALGLLYIPAPSEEAAELGRRLFFDPRLSTDGATSCASCHQPAKSFSDGLPVSRGVHGRVGTRNTPSLLNVVYKKILFWDGRGDALAINALDPIFNPVEHGLTDFETVKRVIAADPELAQLFFFIYRRQASEAQRADVGKALAAYLGTITAGGSAFDRYYFGNESDAMSAAAIRGLQLFQGRAHCAECHTIGEKSALFTDEQFHTLGVGIDEIARQLPALAARVRSLDRDKLGHAILAEPDIAALGRFAVTGKPSDIGKFRTPSLRNVALTAPYMHDGSVATLTEAIDLELYYRSLSSGRPILLSPEEKADLVEFLKALTSDEE